jgi:hypothetical protein
VRVLLDECLPKRLTRELVGHEVRTASEMGGPASGNGELLVLAVGQFDAFPHRRSQSVIPTGRLVVRYRDRRARCAK